MDLVVRFAFGMVLVAIVLVLVRLLRGPTLADRALAVDLLSTLGASLVALHAMVTRSPAALSAVIPLTGMGLLGGVALSRIVERRARGEEKR